MNDDIKHEFISERNKLKNDIITIKEELVVKSSELEYTKKKLNINIIDKQKHDNKYKLEIKKLKDEILQIKEVNKELNDVINTNKEIHINNNNNNNNNNNTTDKDIKINNNEFTKTELSETVIMESTNLIQLSNKIVNLKELIKLKDINIVNITLEFSERLNNLTDNLILKDNEIKQVLIEQQLIYNKNYLVKECKLEKDKLINQLNNEYELKINKIKEEHQNEISNIRNEYGKQIEKVELRRASQFMELNYKLAKQNEEKINYY
jgi:hypothetical protein